MEWFFKERIPRNFGVSEINLDKYVSGILDLPDSPDPEIKLENLQKGLYTYIFLLLIAMCVLMFEVIKNKLEKRKVHSVEQCLIDQSINQTSDSIKNNQNADSKEPNQIVVPGRKRLTMYGLKSRPRSANGNITMVVTTCDVSAPFSSARIEEPIPVPSDQAPLLSVKIARGS